MNLNLFNSNICYTFVAKVGCKKMKTRKNTELFEALAGIAEGDIAVKKVVKYEKKLAAKKKDDTFISKEEFFASLERGMEDYRQGRCVSLQEGESLSDMLKRVGY